MPRRSAPSAKRYAQALFQMAREEGKPDKWLETIEDIVDALAEPQLLVFLDSPEVKVQDKLKAIQELSSRVDGDHQVKDFLSLLVTRRLVGLLPMMVEEYKRLWDIERGIVRAQITTAVPLVDDLKSAIADKLSQMIGQQVIVTFREDPGILGGMRVKVGDMLLDGSTKARLMDLKNSLAEAVL